MLISVSEIDKWMNDYRKITNMSTFSGVKVDLRLVTMFPAVENTLSEGTEVAGTHIKLLANCASLGNLS